MRKDEGKTKEQLLNELEEMRQRIKELEVSETKRKQLEEGLRESEGSLRSLLKSMEELVFVITIDGTFKNYYQPSGREDLYVPPSEFLGKHFKDVLPRDVAESLQSAIKRVKASGEAQKFDYVLEMKGGKSWYDARLSPVKDQSGAVNEVIVVARNITERKRLEHDLAERVKELQCLYSIASIAERPHVTLDELYQEVANLLPDAWQYPEITATRIVINNKRFETESWRETEWKQSSDVKVHGVKAGAVEVCYLEEKPPIGEGPFLIEERHLIDAVAERLGRITERKQAEEALQESEERYRDLFENANDLIQSVAPDGHFLYVNKAWRQTLGYSEEEVANLTIWDIIHPDSIPRCRGIFQKVMSGEAVSNVEATFVAKDGNLVTVEGNANCRFKGGEIVSTRGIFRNITERKRLEEARMEQAAAQARAEEVQQSRQRIIAMQESLRRDIARQIHGAVQNRLIILMHRLADIERSSLSEQIAAEVADLRQKLEEVVEDHIRPISHRLFPSIMRRGLVPALQSLVDQFETAQPIDMELSEELKRQERINPRFIPEQVRLAAYRIAEEALVNATKHAKASRITVKLEPSSEGWLRLAVQDNGRGFDMKSASAGLGILMMRDYAEVVSGSCVITSTPGKGTEVTATVPLAGPGAEHPERA